VHSPLTCPLSLYSSLSLSLSLSLLMATVLRTPTFRPTPPPRAAKSPKLSRVAVVSFRQSTNCRRKPSLLSSLGFPAVPSLRFVRFVPFAFDGDTEAPQVQEPEVQVLVRISLANAFVFCYLFIGGGVGTNFEFRVSYLFGILAFSDLVQGDIC